MSPMDLSDVEHGRWYWFGFIITLAWYVGLAMGLVVAILSLVT